MSRPGRLRALATPLPWPALGELADRAADRLVVAVARRASARTRRGDRLRGALRWPWHAILAWVIGSLLLVDAAIAQDGRGIAGAWLVLLVIPPGVFLLRTPVALGMSIAAGGILLRVLSMGVPETCDQLAVSRAAMDAMAGGANPWGFGYAESVPPGAPFPYGPLAGVISVFGVPGEVAAMAGILVLLAWSRALLMLAFLGGWIAWIELGVCGINDQLPALLLLGGLLLLEGRRLVGGLLVGLSVGIKPYAFAWVPPLIGFGGAATGIVLLAVTAVCWLPALWWGPRSYLDSIELARSIHPRSENTLNLPGLRILAAPFALAALFVRSWSTAVLTGAVIFCLVLFLDFWASFGYWLVVLPPVGIVLERALRDLGARLGFALRDDG